MDFVRLALLVTSTILLVVSGLASDSKDHHQNNAQPIDEGVSPLEAVAAFRKHLVIAELDSHECSNEDYLLSIAKTNGHVEVIAKPYCVGSSLNYDVCEDCPTVAFHTVEKFRDSDGSLEPKKQIIWLFEEDLEEFFEWFLEIGLFELRDLFNAFHKTVIPETESNGTKLIIGILDKLEVKHTSISIILDQLT